MSALWNRAGYYIVVLWFLSSFFFPSFFFFPSPISAVGDWISTILPHNHHVTVVRILNARLKMCCTRIAENTERKNYAKDRHLHTVAQVCRATYSQLRHVSLIIYAMLSDVNPLYLT